MRIEECNWLQVEEYLQHEDRLAIPLGSIEQHAYLSLGVESDAEAERVYAALSDGSEVFMKMQETFFATRFGQLRDRFGINWMVIHERPMAPRA